MVSQLIINQVKITTLFENSGSLRKLRKTDVTFCPTLVLVANYSEAIE